MFRKSVSFLFIPRYLYLDTHTPDLIFCFQIFRAIIMHYNYTTEGRICKAALPVFYVVGSNIVFRFAVFCFFKESAFNISRCTWVIRAAAVFLTVRAVFRRQSAFWDKKIPNMRIIFRILLTYMQICIKISIMTDSKEMIKTGFDPEQGSGAEFSYRYRSDKPHCSACRLPRRKRA